MWIEPDLGGFHGFQAQKGFRPMAACGDGLLSLKEDSRLQYCRGSSWILDAWRLESWILQPRRLVGLLAGWLAGLDWIGFEWLPVGIGGTGGRVLTRSTLREVGG